MKTTIASIISALSGFFMLIALAPPELQNQVPQLFPEAYRGRIAIGLGLLGAIARIYGGKNTQDKLPAAPADTVQKTETVSTQVTQTIPPKPQPPTV